MYIYILLYDFYVEILNMQVITVKVDDFLEVECRKKIKSAQSNVIKFGVHTNPNDGNLISVKNNNRKIFQF